ncbi:MAG: hypothetical protein EU544_05070, partial [Promethearchaeota archaeon]
MNICSLLNIKETQLIDKTALLPSINKHPAEREILKSGSIYLDKVVGGGFQFGQMYLIFGKNKTGKTQLCHQLSVQAYRLLSPRQKPPVLTFYFDCENTFRPERIKELSSHHHLQTASVLKSIAVNKILSTSALWLSFKEFEQNLDPQRKYVIIIDSINNHF